MLKRTPLFDAHQADHAHLVDFAGWEMPLHYGSSIEEHHHVRNNAGLFDVSHMLAIDIHGAPSLRFLNVLLTNDVSKLSIGKALYSCMLNSEGGIKDDLIVYRLGEHHYRLVINAANRVSDLSWIKNIAQAFQVEIEPREDLALIALQGPNALTILQSVLTGKEYHSIFELKPFQVCQINDMTIATTGYTGESGVEMMLPNEHALSLWNLLREHGVPAIGLAARDTLRLEAGLNLYGQDMTEQTTPLESNVAWTVDWHDSDRDFIGKQALLLQKGELKQLVGVVLLDKGVLRKGMIITLTDDTGQTYEGVLTSGGFSPTLKLGIGFARIPKGHFTQASVIIRDKTLPIKVIKLPFLKKGQPNFSLTQ